MKLLLILIALVVFLKLAKNILFWTWAWQVKEYRWDRFRVLFKTASKQKELILGFLPFFVRLKPVYRPDFTKRAIAFLTLSFGLFFSFGLGVWTWLLRLDLIFLFEFFLFVFVLSFSLPFLVTVANFLIGLPVFFVKKWQIKKAKKKLENHPDLVVIGVTGSYGKTSMVHILAHLLKTKYRVLQTPENQNAIFPIAKLINQSLKKSHQVFVVEMGAYKKGEIKQICDLVKPQIGIITGINAQHLELFGSFGQILTTKYELIESLPKDGVGFFNACNRYTKQMFKKTKTKKFLFGEDGLGCQSNLVGNWQKQNLEGALKVALYLGVLKKPARKALKKIPDFPQKTQLYQGRGNALFIDDSYSANPDGFMNALELLKDYPQHQKVVVTPGIIELGYRTKEIHQKIAKKMIKLKIDKLFLTNPDFKNYFQDIFNRHSNSPKLELALDFNQLKQALETTLSSKTVVLLEGRQLKGTIKYLKGKK